MRLAEALIPALFWKLKMIIESESGLCIWCRYTHCSCLRVYKLSNFHSQWAKTCNFPLKNKCLLSLFYLLACYYGNIYMNNSFLQLYLNKVKDCILNIKADQTFFFFFTFLQLKWCCYLLLLLCLRQALSLIIIGHGLKFLLFSIFNDTCT